MNFGKISVTLHPQRLERDQIVAFARQAEQAGLGAVWTVESSFDSIGMAHALLGATESLAVGTCIAARWKRHPMQMAEAAATVDHLYPGRFSIGVGSAGWVGDPRQAWHQGLDRPVARMREYVEVLRAALSGEPVDYSGEFYDLESQVDFGPGARVPIYLAGGGPQMCRLAGRAADGVFIEAQPSSHAASLTESLVTSAFGAGRDPSALRVFQVVPISVAANRDDARETVRSNLLEIALQDPNKQLALADAGFTGEVEAIRRHLATGDWKAAGASISDEMVDLFGLALERTDSAEYVRIEAERLLAPGATDLVLYPYSTESAWTAEYEGVFDLFTALSAS